MLQSKFRIPWMWNSIPTWLHFQQKQPTSHWSWQAHHWRTSHTPSLPLRHMNTTLSWIQQPCQYPLCSLQTCKSLDFPGKVSFRALICLIGLLQQCPYYAIKFYPDTTSNPIYDVCSQHCIPHSILTVFSNTSWQDCPGTGRSTIGYMIFHNSALIKANPTIPTPITLSTSKT